MAVDVQTFTPGTSVWTKPANALWVEMFAIGGGGAGGGGFVNNSGNRFGGGGGGSGSWSRALYAAADLPATANVVCGQGGGALGAQQRCIPDTGTPPIATPAATNSLGMRFTTTAAGFITAIRYWRETNFAHAVSLWNAAGQRLGAALNDVSTGPNGWREVVLPVPIYVGNGARITVSRTQDNQARHDGPAITSSAAANLTSLMGCFLAGGDAYPSTDAGTGSAQNYNVDVVFQPLLASGDSYVGANVDAAWVYASPGSSGADGTSAAGTAGGGGLNGEFPGGAGGASSVAAAAAAGTGGAHTGGGGGGGGISSASASFAGGAGGNNWFAGWGHAQAAGGATNSPGAAGDSFGSIAGGMGGGGGGAGGATGGAGGAGATPGGGGGGGGAATLTPGAPGAGGQGRVVIVTYLSA